MIGFIMCYYVTGISVTITMTSINGSQDIMGVFAGWMASTGNLTLTNCSCTATVNAFGSIGFIGNFSVNSSYSANVISNLTCVLTLVVSSSGEWKPVGFIGR